MAALLLFQSFPIPQAWVWGGATFTLALVSNMNWTNQNGGVHLAGNARLQDLSEPAQLCPGTVNGRVATVQDFFVEPTLLSIDAANSVRITGLLFDENGNCVAILFQAWVIPSTPSPMMWADLTRYNHLRHKTIGVSAMDVVRGWFNGINIISVGDLARLITACGTVQMVNGAAVVPSILVTANSLIKAWSMSNGVRTALWIDPNESHIGVDFTVRSTDPGDNGLIGWEIREPF